VVGPPSLLLLVELREFIRRDGVCLVSRTRGFHDGGLLRLRDNGRSRGFLRSRLVRFDDFHLVLLIGRQLDVVDLDLVAVDGVELDLIAV
jgi:hypothetical protein